jgi:DNA uptake protein ComE-like DNA-binding protein
VVDSVTLQRNWDGFTNPARRSRPASSSEEPSESNEPNPKTKGIKRLGVHSNGTQTKVADILTQAQSAAESRAAQRPSTAPPPTMKNQLDGKRERPASASRKPRTAASASSAHPQTHTFSSASRFTEGKSVGAVAIVSAKTESLSLSSPAEHTKRDARPSSAGRARKDTK